MFQEMIKSENTDGQYERWSAYREALTEFICQTCPRENGNKKVLAIWGAGGCNDIDIRRLSQYYKLVLIDRDVDKLKSARTRFGVPEEACLCVDMHFWDISDQDYIEFEEMLQEGQHEELEDFLLFIKNNMPQCTYSDLPKFDYSVVVGLASQLNVRFAALAYYYKVDISDILLKMNQEAVSRLMEAIESMTLEKVVFGYEFRGNYMTAGNDFLEKELMKLPGKVCGEQILVWPFSKEKTYKVRVLTMFVKS